MSNPRSPQRRPQASGGKSLLTREVKILGGIAAAVAVIAAVIVLQGAPTSSEVAPPPTSSGGVPARTAQLAPDDSPQEGPRDAKVTLVEFLDPECESCGAMFPIVERIRKEYAGRIRFVVRYYPLHRNSVLAAKSMEAAGRQGKYWEMYNLTFEHQAAWGEKNEPQTAVFFGFANQLGLNMDTFQRDLNDDALESKLLRDRNDGVAAGVKGTPTFFINGALMGSMMTYEQMKSRIDAALK